MRREISGTFWRFLSLYLTLLVLLVTMLVISGVFVSQLNQKNVRQNAANGLTAMRDSFERKLEQMQTVVDLLAYDEAIVYKDLKDDPVSAIFMQRRLKSYHRTMMYLYNMIVHIKGIDTLYAATSTYRLQTYAEKVCKYETLSTEAFIQMLDNVKGMVLYPTTNVELIYGVKDRLLTCIYPLYSEVSAGYASVLFQLQEAVIKADMQPALLSEGSNALIFHGTELLASYTPVDAATQAALLEELQSAQGENRFASIGGQRRLITTLTSDRYPLRYVSYIPEASAMALATNATLLLMLVLLAVVLAGLAILLYFMRLNYLPLKRLREALARTGQSLDYHQSEAEAAYQVIESLRMQQNELAGQMKSSKQELDETMLDNFIHGTMSLAQYNALAKENALDSVHTHFRVLLMSRMAGQTWNGTKLERLKQCVQASLPGCEARFLHESTRRLVLLIASQSEDEERIAAVAVQLNAWTEGAFGMVAVGNCYASWLRIHDSYLECETLLRQWAAKPTDETVLLAHDKTIFYPAYELGSLQHALQDGDLEAVKQTAKVLCSIVEHSLSPISARMVGYDTLNTILQFSIANMPLRSGKQAELRQRMAALLAGSHAKEISDAIAHEIAVLLTYMDLSAKEDPFLRQLLTYMEEHCGDQDFSIQMMADHFDIKQNNLSQQFKRAMNQTPLRYVTQLRIEKGRDLLASTDLPLRTIATSVGFLNESTFIRKFKELLGMTPGEYRKERENA